MSVEARELEIQVERPARAYARERGWWACKFVSPGKRGVPDDLFIRDGRHVFVEFKRFGEPLRVQQEKVIREMRQHGAEVHVIDNLKDAYELLR